jgi:hypothetical protein
MPCIVAECRRRQSGSSWRRRTSHRLELPGPSLKKTLLDLLPALQSPIPVLYTLPNIPIHVIGPFQSAISYCTPTAARLWRL